jgi:hypothetical protein
MASQEFYIREGSETEARGPFNTEQLISLAEAGQVTAETLYYDAGTEQWAAVGSNAEVKALIFPEKRKLTIKAKEIVSLNQPKSDSQAPITVDDILAAAEGKTADTKDRKDPEIAAGRAARIGSWSAIFILVIAAAGELLPASDAILTMDPNKILAQPLALLGAVDLLLAVLLGLGLVTLYPFIRFRAAAGFGFFGFLFYVQGLKLPLIAAAGGAAGLYLCTIIISVLPVTIAAAAGIAGMAGAAYYLLSA